MRACVCTDVWARQRVARRRGQGVAPPADVVCGADGMALCEGELVLHWRTGEAAGGQGQEVSEEVEGCDVLEHRLIRASRGEAGVRTTWDLEGEGGI